MKNKIKPEEAVAKIRVLIDKYYEKLGREGKEYSEEMNIVSYELLEKIEEVLNNTDISPKNLVMEKIR